MYDIIVARFPVNIKKKRAVTEQLYRGNCNTCDANICSRLIYRWTEQHRSCSVGFLWEHVFQFSDIPWAFSLLFIQRLRSRAGNRLTLCINAILADDLINLNVLKSLGLKYTLNTIRPNWNDWKIISPFRTNPNFFRWLLALTVDVPWCKMLPTKQVSRSCVRSSDFILRLITVRPLTDARANRRTDPAWSNVILTWLCCQPLASNRSVHKEDKRRWGLTCRQGVWGIAVRVWGRAPVYN
jgi:hypothetical protein